MADTHISIPDRQAYWPNCGVMMMYLFMCPVLGITTIIMIMI
jgi:hypothetical protein